MRFASRQGASEIARRARVGDTGTWLRRAPLTVRAHTMLCPYPRALGEWIRCFAALAENSTADTECGAH